MPVYLIRAGEHGPIKIGFSDDVAGRLSKMQADNHERLNVLRIFVGGIAEEQALHIQFADHRLHGEWFSFTRRMLNEIDLAEVAPPPPIEVPPPPPVATLPVWDSSFLAEKVRDLRKAHGKTQFDLAAAAGVSRSTIASIEGGHDLPGRELMVALAQVFDVSVGSFFTRPQDAQQDAA